MGDWYRVLYRGSWSAPGTREAFHGSNALIGCALFSSSSLYIILPIPEWSLNFDSSSISLVILGSSGGISSSSSSVSPRLFRRCLTTKTSTVIQTQMFIKYTQQQFHFVSDFTWCVSWILNIFWQTNQISANEKKNLVIQENFSGQHQIKEQICQICTFSFIINWAPTESNLPPKKTYIYKVNCFLFRLISWTHRVLAEWRLDRGVLASLLSLS